MDSFKVNDVINIIDDGVPTKKLIQKIIDSGIDEAFFIADIKALIEQHLYFQKLLPNVESFYAVKCNPNKMFLAALAALGLSFDCASIKEIQTILDLGVDPSKIVFALPTKPMSHIRYATEKNVHLTVFDHDCELEKIKSVNPNAQLLIRIKCDAKKAMITFGNKFGCDVETDVPRILTTARKMGMNVVGACFNVGTSCQEPEAFYRGIQRCRRVFDIAKTIGFQMNIVDVGGGFPYHSRESLDPFAENINSALNDHFPASEFKNLRVLAEPGRYYCTPALTNACQIHTVKSAKDQSNNETFSYYLTDGIYGSFLYVRLDKGTIAPYTLKDTNENTKLFPCTIYGPTCDGTDKILTNYLLPKLGLNDWIVNSDVGAYSIGASTCFNGFSIPQFVYVCGESMAKQFLNIDSIKHLFVDSRRR